MNEKLREAKNTVVRQSLQGLIALLFCASLCYVVVFGGAAAEFKDLFSNAVIASIAFYFGRETKTNNGGN